MSNYVFHWKEEAFYAAATFIAYFMAAYVATGEVAPDSWEGWVIATAAAAARVTVAGLMRPLTAFIASRKS